MSIKHVEALPVVLLDSRNRAFARLYPAHRRTLAHRGQAAAKLMTQAIRILFRLA